MSGSTDKTLLLRALSARLGDELASIEASQRAAQQGAVHPESRQEDPKDTRAIEAGYLARGLAERAETLRRAHEMLVGFELVDFSEDTPIAASALVTLEDESEGRRLRVFLLPMADGKKIVVGDCEVRPVSPASPLGRALVGRSAGESVEVRTPAGVKTWIVVAVE
jgi:transcription elongation GreA/GreB family factor